MKLQFEANLQYQEQAVSAVVDLFRGQTPKRSVFTVTMEDDAGQMTTDNGIANKLELIEDEILENLQAVQLRNGLPQAKMLKKGACDFDIEMETGTGKTYVYLRTIFELNKAYGFKKFIIVVPSIAIKEGVAKSLEITKEHFQTIYNNVVYDTYIYDGSKPEEVRSFAVNDNISIMVINIAAFRKSFDDPEKENKANIIHRAIDKLNGMRPISLIQETNPIVIVDEPQSVEGKGATASKKAMESLNALCTLRYSATHVEKHNLVYKLDAVDAFDLELVKQIEVASFESLDYHNKAYMKLLSVDNKKSPITAKIELDCEVKGTIKRKAVTVRQGDDLSEKLSGYREVYNGYVVDDIYCEKGNEYVSFTTKPEILRIGEAVGDIDDRAIKEQQIRKTIEEHLNKELVLNRRGIKVLSLFFIDKVSNYRYYDTDGVRHNGIYADMFEKNYRELIQRPKYRTLFQDQDIDLESLPHEVHGGYFSGDKKGGNSDKEWKDTSGTTAVDESAYNLIMRDKEKLLSFDSNLFKKNPQAYMDQVAKLISSTMQLFILDGIKYTKLGDTEFYAQELFDSEELTGYLERNMFESHRSVYDYVVYDSDVEHGFAEKLESNESVKVYAKLPNWFKVPTPLGSYNPDWAVVIEDNGLNKLYFVVETKGSIEGKDLRPKEQAKIRCGEKHFAALGNDAKFMKADSFQRFTERLV